MSVAIVHEWLTFYAGSEKVVEQLCPVLEPTALYTLVDHLVQDRPAFLNDMAVKTSILQKLPFSRSKYRSYLPLMPFAIEQLDVTAHDLVVSSHHCVAHGVITRPDQLHLVYTHSPMRYSWDLQEQYLVESGISAKKIKGSFARLVLHYLRLWDRAAGQRPDYYAANSRFIAQRIRKYYGREATVIHPPVDVDAFTPNSGKREDYYFTASRMVPYKKILLIVQTFSLMPDKKLIVLGDGPENERIRREAGSNVLFLGYQPDLVLKQYLSQAKAFVFAAQEDFGILPVEAQACGIPVIALGRGGTAETVIDGKTGVLFSQQTIDSLREAVARFESIIHQFHPEEIRVHAEKFSIGRFRKEFAAFVDRCQSDFSQQ